ncbi:hypothetical protein BU15DRAFT_83571 [Melanogaster broomeanus]|nr:hypothetical protein BU15DRAFT_83571 [Melanogaster broomeanus]
MYARTCCTHKINHCQPVKTTAGNKHNTPHRSIALLFSPPPTPPSTPPCPPPPPPSPPPPVVLSNKYPHTTWHVYQWRKPLLFFIPPPSESNFTLRTLTDPSISPPYAAWTRIFPTLSTRHILRMAPNYSHDGRESEPV